MPISIDEDVIGLNIPVNVVHAVHLINGNDELSDVEASLCLAEDILFNQQAQQITPRHPLHGDI